MLGLWGVESVTSSWSVSAEKGEVEPCIFRIRLEQQIRQFCHANRGTSKRSVRRYWVSSNHGLKACMHSDIKVRAGVVGGSSRTRLATLHAPCSTAHTHHDSGLETTAVDWAHEPTFQKQPLSCHNRPPSVAGPQHIARCCCCQSSPPRSPVGKKGPFWAVKMQAGTSAGAYWGDGFFLFRSPAPALTVSC